MFDLRVAAPVAALVLLVSLAVAQGAGREALVIETAGGRHAFQVEIADDPRERSLGLMYRRSMGADEGMLFDFFEEQPASFWMRNTYISLDMLFLKADGTIDSIAERTTPLSDRSVPSRGPVRFVLELNGGTSESLGIEPGHRVTGPAIESRQ